jgi:hypothetical protein
MFSIFCDLGLSLARVFKVTERMDPAVTLLKLCHGTILSLSRLPSPCCGNIFFVSFHFLIHYARKEFACSFLELDPRPHKSGDN